MPMATQAEKEQEKALNRAMPMATQAKKEKEAAKKARHNRHRQLTANATVPIANKRLHQCPTSGGVRSAKWITTAGQSAGTTRRVNGFKRSPTDI